MNGWQASFMVKETGADGYKKFSVGSEKPRTKTTSVYHFKQQGSFVVFQQKGLKSKTGVKIA